ncbi:MAG: hypothetical protein R3208_03260 [Ketobacteraceae bacterium]|nr:hypothetical protein [Ketobacteraceae bacterium]
MKTLIKTIALAGITLLAGGCGETGEFSMQPTSLRIVDTDDSGSWFDPADEPYIGIIHFQGFFSNPDSVTVTTNTDLTTLSTSAGEGDIISLISEFSDHSFGSLFTTTSEQLNDGAGIWVAGAIYIGVDHDNPGKGNVRDAIVDIADALEDSLRVHIGGGSWGILGDGFWEALQNVMADLDEGNDGGGSGWFTRMIADDLVGTGIFLHMGIEQDFYDDLLPIWEAVAASEGVEFFGCENGQVSICPMQTTSKVLHLNETDSEGDYRLTVTSTFN